MIFRFYNRFYYQSNRLLSIARFYFFSILTIFKSLFLPRVAGFIYIEGDNKRVSSAEIINFIYNVITKNTLLLSPSTYNICWLWLKFTILKGAKRQTKAQSTTFISPFRYLLMWNKKIHMKINNNCCLEY